MKWFGVGLGGKEVGWDKYKGIGIGKIRRE